MTDDNKLEARREKTTEKLAKFIERTLAEAPPLTDEQTLRLTGLLLDARSDD